MEDKFLDGMVNTSISIMKRLSEGGTLTPDELKFILLTKQMSEKANKQNKSNRAQVTACGIRTRTRYSVCVSTTATGGTFKMLGSPCCSPSNNLRSINGTTPTPAPTLARVEEAAPSVQNTKSVENRNGK